MIKKCQIEERLAVAIHKYVRACGAARSATTIDEMEDARALKAERRKMLGGIESTFHKLNGDEDAMRRRLAEIIVPHCPRGYYPNVTFESGRDTEYEEVP